MLALSLWVFYFHLIEFSHAEAPVELPRILKTGPSISPADLLSQDPVSPIESGRPDPASGSAAGTMQKGLNESLALPITGGGAPGNAVLMRGLGRSAEETDVQALGVPLNPPQGGGFDLSIFPAFIWSNYAYQRGPALGTFDPRGTSGSLNLTPWTANALLPMGASPTRGPRARATQSFSTNSITQTSVAGTDGQQLAAVVGNSSGDARGPSGALSARADLSEGGRLTASVHFLATDLEAKIPGSRSYPTPEARQRTVRLIPIAQLDWRAAEHVLIKTSVFTDWSSLRYEDPTFSAVPSTYDRIAQYGVQSAALFGAWKAGLSFREVRYRSFLDNLSEEVASAQLSRVWEWGGWMIEPTVRAVGVTRTGVLPEASLGTRWEFMPGWNLFSRASLSRRFPSLVNRYYRYAGFPGYPGFQGNPSLAAERDWTYTGGVEAVSGPWLASLVAYAQWAQDAQVKTLLTPTLETLINQGSARIVSISPTVGVQPSDLFSARASVTFSSSRISGSGLEYPGLAPWIGVFSVGVPQWRAFDARSTVRVASSSIVDSSGTRVAAYQDWSFELGWRPWSKARLSGRLDNLLNQAYELIPDYPSVGRTGSILLQAEI